MADRYFVEPPVSGNRAVLSGSEAHHLIHVMRAKPGAQVRLFDGTGAEFVAEIGQVRRGEVELTVLEREWIDRELPVQIDLAVALPKGDRQRWLAEKAVELGVGRLVPLKTARCSTRPNAQTLKRLRRTVIEASKQCGRNRLMEVGQPQGWADLVADTRDCGCRLLCHPGGSGGLGGPLSAVGAAQAVVLAVGPEGGFTEAEVSLATSTGWQVVDLGPRVLRVETAAITLAAVISYQGARQA